MATTRVVTSIRGRETAGGTVVSLNKSRPTHKTMTEEVEESLDRKTREGVLARADKTHKEVAQDVTPIKNAFKRLGSAIMLTETKGETPAQVGEIDVIFIGDNTSSMNGGSGGNGLLNINDSQTFAKIEERIIVALGDAFSELSDESDTAPFKAQGILYGFPHTISYQQEDGARTIDVTDKTTGDYIANSGVYAKEVTQLDTFSPNELHSMLIMQGSTEFRSGPTLVSYPLDLASASLQRNSITHAEVTAGKNAPIVVVASDFDIDPADRDRARQKVEALRAKGARVIGIGIEGDRPNPYAHETMQYILNSDGKEHGKFIHSSSDLITLIISQAELEDKVSGADSTAVVQRPEITARRTRSRTIVGRTTQ